jgi:hypothetical protein
LKVPIALSEAYAYFVIDSISEVYAYLLMDSMSQVYEYLYFGVLNVDVHITDHYVVYNVLPVAI